MLSTCRAAASFSWAVSCGTSSAASCSAAALAISHAECFFRMKATARVAVMTGSGILADICVMWNKIEVRWGKVNGSFCRQSSLYDR
ncbi:hypothetical protein EV424DRAFT_1428050 [Suillus variegatus]|nr:hypothetical protein EV424DRAFT_1428050 [Suillus variegatus]